MFVLWSMLSLLLIFTAQKAVKNEETHIKMLGIILYIASVFTLILSVYYLTIEIILRFS